MMELACIYLNGNISNIYINTGYYAQKVADEMKDNGYSDVVLERIKVDLTSEQLRDLLLTYKKD